MQWTQIFAEANIVAFILLFFRFAALFIAIPIFSHQNIPVTIKAAMAFFFTVVFYSSTLGVPVRRNIKNKTAQAGERIFNEIGCSRCHLPEIKTGKVEFPELSNQTIRPYTDLLLHDMGDGLADGRPDFLATGKEWRTPPLWGIGLVESINKHTRFLHDGRARNLMEAVLWHGGEAEQSKQAVLGLNKNQRDALIAFLQSL